MVKMQIEGSKPVVPTHAHVEFETGNAKPHDKADDIFKLNCDEYSCYEHVPLPGLKINLNHIEINKNHWENAFNSLKVFVFR